MTDPLAQFLGAYFHQDYMVVSGSVEGAVKEFRDSASEAQRRAVIDGLNAVLADSGDGPERLVAEEADINPDAWGGARGFLTLVLQLLSAREAE